MEQNDKIQKIRKPNRACRNPYYVGIPIVNLPYINPTASTSNHKYYCLDYKLVIKSPLNNSFEKRVLMANIQFKKYNAKEFTDDLLNELNNFPEEMYKLNPNRVMRSHSGCTLQDISLLWGHHKSYVSERLSYHRDKPEYILPNRNLKELEINLNTKFGDKAKRCYEIIDLHKEGIFSFDKFINKFQIELGRISKCVNTTIDELGLIFNYGYGMMNYIRNNNDNYVLSKERLSIISNNLRLVLRNKVQNALEIVQKYKENNPNLPDYANQKYTIINPHFFSDIYLESDTTYWFGWLCSDGWASQIGNHHYQIQLNLKRKDRTIIERFATAIGYGHDRIFDENYLSKDENGDLKTNYRSRIIFGCKPMWYDLKKLGIFEFKNQGRVPQCIKDLINRAKVKRPNGHLIETREGCLALRFLLGFYDGDGNYRGGMSARILNSKKKFLEEVVDLFNISNEVNINAKKVTDEKTGRINWKTRYQLHLGPEIFRQMLLSYENSLQRKRPDQYKHRN